MSDLYIKRRLKIGDEIVTEAEAIARGAVLIVLAEPGAGKTDLLAEFGRILGVSPLRGSIFQHKTQFSGNAPLIVDALDEVAKLDQSALNQIVVKAQEVSNGRVIFASRSSEWQQARTNWIKDCFGVEPVIVWIEHFTESEQKELFDSHLPGEDFHAFAAEVSSFDLQVLLGNPQFLILFADAYIQSDRRFQSKAQIFRSAVERLALDTGNTIVGSPRPPVEHVICAASGLMLTLLLSGASGVASAEHLSDQDYPYYVALAAGEVQLAQDALGTRLFKPATGPELHDPVHRIVAEYCGAHELVRRVSDPLRPFSLRRALSVIAPNGVVRSELRGLLGWMASIGNVRIQQAAIALDAYAVLANGDPSQLTAASKRLLLEKLAALAENNPGFRRSDHWRRFSVGSFFTEDMTAQLKELLRSVPVTSPLIKLILDLLENSGGPIAIAADIEAILLNKDADYYTRRSAASALMKVAAAIPESSFKALVQEASSDSLYVVAQVVTESGADTYDTGCIESVLRAFVELYPPRRRLRDENSYMASYHVAQAISQLSVPKTTELLDRLSDGLGCTCGKEDYECQCRNGMSRIIGLLLDHYFRVSAGPHDAVRIWVWVKGLWYEGRGKEEGHPAIETLAKDNALRHALQRNAFAHVADYEGGWNAYWSLNDGHRHAGLSFRPGDALHLAEFAFETDNPGMWSALWQPPASRHGNQGPDDYRKKLRGHALSKPAFGREWALRERGFRAARLERQRRWERRNKRYMQREEHRIADNRTSLVENRDLIASGNHWSWTRYFADTYFSDGDQLAKLTDDKAMVEDALRNCLPMLADHIPTLEKLSENNHPAVARVAFVSCWLQFIDRKSLDHVDLATLMAVKVASGRYSQMDEASYQAFQKELDRLLFPTPGDAAEFAAVFIEPTLLRPRERSTNVSWLGHHDFLAHLRPTLAIDWLRKYPDMPASARDTLFDIAASVGDRSVLLNIIAEGVTTCSSEPAAETPEARLIRLNDLAFWELRKFFFESSSQDGWDEFSADPDVILTIADCAGRLGDQPEGWPSLGAEKIWKILDRFVDVWRPVPLPSGYGTGDPPEEVAYRFLTDIVWRIGRDTPDRALPVLERLIGDHRFVGFSDELLTLRSEAFKTSALSSYRPPAALKVDQMLRGAGVATVEDLRALVVEELGWLQTWLRTAETDPLAQFYNNGQHVDENTARNRVVDILVHRMTAANLPIVIEHHMADNNRCDFTVSATIEGRRRLLVVEAKGQWHRKLFTAAAEQLNTRYASHQDAEKQGVYLVFWFGQDERVANRVGHGIMSPNDLRDRIMASMPQELRPVIDVVVLDVSRPTAG